MRNWKAIWPVRRSDNETEKTIWVLLVWRDGTFKRRRKHSFAELLSKVKGTRIDASVWFLPLLIYFPKELCCIIFYGIPLPLASLPLVFISQCFTFADTFLPHFPSGSCSAFEAASLCTAYYILPYYFLSCFFCALNVDVFHVSV
jgi:hypothetical protein